jgi:hypothetical protein
MGADTANPVSTVFRLKRALVHVSLLAFGMSFELLSKIDPQVKEEIKVWPEGWRFRLGVLPEGPAVNVVKQAGRMVCMGMGVERDVDLGVMFKNVDSCLLVFTAQIGSPTAFAEHRAVCHGSIQQAMQVSRAMDIITLYLFPRLINRRTFKRMPPLSLTQLVNNMKLYLLIGPALAAGALRK